MMLPMMILFFVVAGEPPSASGFVSFEPTKGSSDGNMMVRVSCDSEDNNVVVTDAVTVVVDVANVLVDCCVVVSGADGVDVSGLPMDDDDRVASVRVDLGEAILNCGVAHTNVP
jgi:hypothetical protein